MNINSHIRGFWILATLFFTGSFSMAGETIDISYRKFVLDNGLTLIVHEDHKAPIVAVNVWYHVGSKNEKLGRTGFAHLFEHLMFNGTENFNNDYFIPLEKVGATDLNGTTNEDRTNYFQNVPTNALDLVLWMESDRMGHLLGAIGQEKLDEQRGVVQNEKRQYENQPYSISYELITKNTFPMGHPYSWTVIGSMEDLDAASLEDVHEWFKTYYGPSNAVISIAGDIDSETVKRKVELYFGDIPPGRPVVKQEVWVHKMVGTHRQVAQDRVPLARIYKVWNIPQWGAADADYLGLVSDVLTDGKNSRLFKRLVYDDQIASNVTSYLDLREIAGQFNIVATAQPGVDIQEVEKAIDEEMDRFIRRGPTRREIQRIKTQHRARFIRGIERIGGFGGKSDRLARSEVYGGRPDFYKTTMKRIQAASSGDLKAAAKRWLTDGVFVLEIHPFPDYATQSTDIDRAHLPDVGSFPGLDFPDLQKAQLSNGLNIILAERHEIPLVNMTLVLDAGHAADQFGLAGTASMTMSMLDEGTQSRTSLEISEELDDLAAVLGAGSSLDVCMVSLSVLKENMEAVLAIYTDVILNPVFPENEFQRLKKQRLASIKQEKSNSASMAMRVLPKLLYGEGHAYSNPITGTGTEKSNEEMTRDNLVQFHETWFKPKNNTMVIVGNITMDEIITLLETQLGGWLTMGATVKKKITRVPFSPVRKVYLIDKPGAIQSMVIAGHLAPPTNNPNKIPIETMNSILGGTFTSRINMNLREDKHWTYGARTLFVNARGQRMFFVRAPVQTDKTVETIQEIDKEIRGILGTKPVTDEELIKAQKGQTLRLPGRFETARAVMSAILEMVQYGISEDYYETYSEKVNSLQKENITSIAHEVLRPDNMIWLIVGDREKVEEKIRDLELGELNLIDVE